MSLLTHLLKIKKGKYIVLRKYLKNGITTTALQDLPTALIISTFTYATAVALKKSRFNVSDSMRALQALTTPTQH